MDFKAGQQLVINRRDGSKTPYRIEDVRDAGGGNIFLRLGPLAAEPEQPGDPMRVYVIAGDYRQFTDWCQRNEINPTDTSRAVCIDSVNRLQGLSGPGYVAVWTGTFAKRSDYRELRFRVEAQGLHEVYDNGTERAQQ